MSRRSGLLVCAGAFLGCASGPRPIASPEASAAAFRAAEELNAAGDPRGALYLQLAKEGMERGKEMVVRGDHERAEAMFARAEADADVALAVHARSRRAWRPSGSSSGSIASRKGCRRRRWKSAFGGVR